MQSNREYYLNRLIQKKHSPYIKIVTGIRRCGKSYLLKKLFCNHLLSQGIERNQVIVVELDDDRFEDLRKKMLSELILKKKHQMMPGSTISSLMRCRS